MVIGIPNVGKSTFINRLNGANIVRAADRPGVTRVSQWVKVGPYLELLDTPGMLWPRIAIAHSGYFLAASGAIGRNAYDDEVVALELLAVLRQDCADARPVLFARNVSRPDQVLRIVPLDQAAPEMADMRTLVIVGNSATRVIDTPRGPILYTPRSA